MLRAVDAPSRRHLRLPLIAPGSELVGAAPAGLERAARTCEAGDRTHRGLVFLAAHLARHALSACAPPDSTAAVASALAVAEGWCSGATNAESAARARSDAFVAATVVERRTAESVERALSTLPRRKATPLDAHADHVAVRHARLGATHACGAVLLVLDAVAAPPESALVVQQAAGALAYRSTGLGSARSSELRAAAWEAAEWEAERGAGGRGAVKGLAVELFHEFLGARWKDHSDAFRLHLSEFAEWALGGAT